MALHDADKNPTASSRYDPRNSAGYTPYIIATAVLVAGLFYFFGDTFSARTTLPPSVTSVPQTTTPAPATK
jgi:hypothetical protein